ncbi:MAG: PTS system mannose/fructose/sorbose family transporter subunit IID [Sporolactobacillus sp.]|nr:PTS system mannose/fructose/sorbose family transporter subunit IID [Sporolactobacillus sp.]
MTNSENNSKGNQSVLTKKDIRNAWIKWHAFSETSLNFERLQSLAFCYSLTDILKKLYPKKQDLSTALKRHLTMYNTQANWGVIVNGITISLEENAAQSNDSKFKSTTSELVTGLKTGLMGPVAGIGDSLDFGTLRPIVIGICIPFVLHGSVIASLIPLIFQVTYMAIVSSKMVRVGYHKGKESIVDVLKSGAIHKVIDAAGMFGLFMMGALSSTYVKLTTPIVISNEGSKDIVIQKILDGTLPNVLPFLVVFAIFFYILKRGPHYLKILFGILIFCLAGSFLGVI